MAQDTNGTKLRGPAYFFASCDIVGIAEGQGAAVSNRRRMKTVDLTGMSLK